MALYALETDKRAVASATHPPVLTALKSGAPSEVVRRLVKACQLHRQRLGGAHQPEHGATPLRMVMDQRRLDLLPLLLETADLRNPFGPGVRSVSAIYYAVKLGSIELVDAVVKVSPAAF